MATTTAPKSAAGPACVGIIMDGNRRWAKRQGLLKLQGHRAGSDRLKQVVRAARLRGVKHLITYAFSTENWNRDPEEVSHLMDLFRESIQKEMEELGKEGVRIRFVGQRERFSPDLQRAMAQTEENTKNNDAITLWCCLSYGGRAEIVKAAQEAAGNGGICEEAIGSHLWTAGMPDPDIIIRTGGERRLSGFLPWQTIYSELFFSDTLWPDFSEQEFDRILAEYGERERRHGK